MKKIYLSVINILFIIALLIGCKSNSTVIDPRLKNQFKDPEYSFLINNDISYDELSFYLVFSSFDIFRFFEYEEVRKSNNYSYLEALNHVNYPNYYNFYILPREARFLDKSWALVNKCFFLAKDYVPSDLVSASSYDISYIVRNDGASLLRNEVLEAYEEMYKDALKEGVSIVLFSGYRGFDKQSYLYYEVNNCNDNTVARPGFSEHQLGLSVDISDLEYGLTSFFQESRSYSWLIANCSKYGFILRYPEGCENITGYSYEPWHFRYVGCEISEKIGSLTLEEYLFCNYEL